MRVGESSVSRIDRWNRYRGRGDSEGESIPVLTLSFVIKAARTEESHTSSLRAVVRLGAATYRPHTAGVRVQLT